MFVYHRDELPGQPVELLVPETMQQVPVLGIIRDVSALRGEHGK